MGDLCHCSICVLLNHRADSQFLGLSGIYYHSIQAGGGTSTWCTIFYVDRQLVFSICK